MSKTPSLSIVIPVYNGEATVAELVTELSKLAIEGGHEIILVDDGSRDGSAAICEGLALSAGAAPITFIKLSRNFGEHNAVMAGLAEARGDYVITADDDLQNPPGEVARLHDYARASDYDVVYTHYTAKQHSPARNLGSWFANLTANLVMDKPKGVYLSTFRCMNRFLVDAIQRYSGPFPYIDGLIMQSTQSIGRFEVEHLARRAGQSNYTLRRLIRLWLSILLNFSVIPLRISTFLGVAMSVLGFVMLGAVIYEYFAIGVTSPGWGSLMSAVVLFAGVQLMILGVVGEYLGRLYMTVNSQPQYLVVKKQGGTTPTDTEPPE